MSSVPCHSKHQPPSCGDDNAIRNAVDKLSPPSSGQTNNLFSERYRIADRNSPNTVAVTSWLKEIGDRLLQAGDVTLKAVVTYHIADSDEVNAFVAHHGESAKVVVSRGLLQQIVKNEDMLAAVIGHELMHIHFRERFQRDDERLVNTKVEEYVADVASTALWMMRAGYAPHQAVALWDTFREHALETEQLGGKFVKPWVAFTDEHGLLENRAQAINMVIAKEIKERGAVPTEITRIGADLRRAIATCHHTSYVEGLIQSSGYAQLSPEQKVTRLLQEVRQITSENPGRLRELEGVFAKTLKDCTITSLLVEEIYATLKDNKLPQKSSFLSLAVNQAKRQGHRDAAPQELKDLAETISTFVKGRSDDEINKAASKMVAFAEMWGGINPGAHLAKPTPFKSPLLSEDEMPWDRHLNLARTMSERGHPEIIYALWMSGAYEARLLSLASNADLERLKTLPEFVSVSQAHTAQLSPSGSWERTPPGGEILGGVSIREQYRELADATSAERNHRKRVSTQQSIAELSRFSSLQEVPIELMATNVEGTLSNFSDQLAHPNQVRSLTSSTRGIASAETSRASDEDQEGPENDNEEWGGIQDPISGASDELSEHYREARILSRRFEELLNLENAELRRQAADGIRAFYLNDHGPCYRSLIGPHPEDGISTANTCRHPLILFAAQCTALSAEERVAFLRGLEASLPDEAWGKAYFTGYTFTDAREQLRHLEKIGAQQPAARELGARLLIAMFDKLGVGKEPVIPIVAEHKMFFPALRQADDDERQTVLDHIEALSSWDAPLEQLVDLFWALEQSKLFPPAPHELREKLRSLITTGTAAIPDPVERQMMAERLLLSPTEERIRISEVFGDAPNRSKRTSSAETASKREEMVNQNTGLLSLKDPKLRDAVTDIWSNAIREQIHTRYPHRLQGRDDNTARYIEVTKPQIDETTLKLRRRLPIQERREMLGALADQLELQETLSYLIRDGIVEKNRAEIMDAHEYLRSAEAGFEFLNQDRYRRDAVIRFLSQPLTLASLREFSTRADVKREREIQAVTNTLNSMQEECEAEVDSIQSRIEIIDRYTDPDHRLSNKLEDLRGPLRASVDLLEAFDADSLSELIESYLPESLPDSARKRVQQRCSQGNEDRAFTHEEARKLTIQIGEIIREEFRSLIQADSISFNTTLQEALAEVSNAANSTAPPPMQVIKPLILGKLANLPAYDFVESLEDKIVAAGDTKQLATILQRSLNGLAKSMEREQRKGEEECAKRFGKVLMAIERGRRELLATSSSLETDLPKFQVSIATLLDHLPDLTNATKFPALVKIKNASTATLLSGFLEEDWDEVFEELPSLELDAYNSLDKLHNDLQVSRERQNRMSAFAGGVTSELSEIKRTPTPVISVVEHAGQQVESFDTGDAFHGAEFVKTFSRLYPEKRRQCNLPVTPFEEQQARQLYELFWSQSAENRAIALKLLILPPEAEYQDRRSGKDSHFKGAFNFVADQIFPSGMKYGTEARKILQIFLEETDSSLRGFMLAALMAASEKVAGAPEEYSAGKRLSMILSMMGPAEKKLGQAINSHPSTPEDLRADTKSIKSMSDPLPRWELLARVKDAVPREYQETALPRIGKTLGAASYYIALDCDDSVLSILRPHARTLAQTGLDRMHSIAIRLSNDDSMKHVARPFIESIQQAREMIDVETNHQKGTIQQENAWRRYEGLSIVVDGERFDFATATWKACGPEFRHQERVHGEHFLDMIEGVDPSDPFLRKSALAHVAAELRSILSGDTFDHDRHGAQSKIQRGNGAHSIGLFDHGCMALQPPTQEEKRDLANLLCDLVEGFMNGKTGILHRAHEVIRQKREAEGKIPSYLVSVERALLALNDFMRFDSKGDSSLLSKADLGTALVAVFQTGQVDPMFAKTIAVRFGGAAASPFVNFLSNEKLCARIAEALKERSGPAASISIKQRSARPSPRIIVFDAPRSAA